MTAEDAWREQLEALGDFIRSQRKLAQLSLRDLAERTQVSNPYLSQVERGLHEPSVRVLRSIAKALDLSTETMLCQAGLLQPDEDATTAAAADTETALKADIRLTDEQKEALLAVYRSYVAGNG